MTTVTLSRALALMERAADLEAGWPATRAALLGTLGETDALDERMLRLPDYSGNNMFQTLGNIAADPRVGLLFVDFDTGTTLQLTGKARLLWDRPDFAELKGAERAVEIQVEEIVETQGHGPLGWRFREYSPFNPR